MRRRKTKVYKNPTKVATTHLNNETFQQEKESKPKGFSINPV
jgi:hypothetical protein